MSQQFEVTLIVEGTEEAEPDALKFAIDRLLKFARRVPPDRRFNWGNVAIDAQPYQF